MNIRTFCQVLAAAAVLGSAASASAPLSLAFVDRTGTRITCGSAVHPLRDLAVREDATNAQLHSVRATLAISDYAAQCGTLIADRQTITVSVATLGAMIGAGSFYRRTRRPARAVAPRPRQDAVDIPVWTSTPVSQTPMVQAV